MAKAKKQKRKKARKGSSHGKGVPRRKPNESRIAYHDRLSTLAAEALDAGDEALSKRLQAKAGKLAHDHPEVARRTRTSKVARRGPGTYPWYQCVRDQVGRGMDKPRAQAICGRIRANSRARYPDYWNARERAANPTLGGSGKPPEDPYAALALDGGPRSPEGHRDLLVVVDRHGTILDLQPIMGEHDLAAFDSKYPDLPIFGPLQVLASNIREIIRAAERGPLLVESKA